MSTKSIPSEKIISKFWAEIAEPEDPFVPSKCLCAGYDVYGELINKVSWIDYLFLLIRQDAPSRKQHNMLNTLAVALANPGPRDMSVHAAMSGGAGGSTLASCLIAAISVGAGNYNGAHEVVESMKLFQKFDLNLEAWVDYLENFDSTKHDKNNDVWLNPEHPPGFTPHFQCCASPILQTLSALEKISDGKTTKWLHKNRTPLEQASGMPIGFTSVAAATFCDLGFDLEQAEVLFLLLRLPGAAAHALEQRELGLKHFPFYSDHVEVTNDPAKESP